MLAPCGEEDPSFLYRFIAEMCQVTGSELDLIQDQIKNS